MYYQTPYQINIRHWLVALGIALLAHAALLISYKIESNADEIKIQKNITINLKNISIAHQFKKQVIENKIIDNKPIPIAKPVKKRIKKIHKKTEKIQLVKPVRKTKPLIEPLPFVKEIINKPSETSVQKEGSEFTEAIRKNYELELISWLNQHKKYPKIARRRGYEGSVVLSFEIDRNGNLLFYDIKQSSKYDSLNKAVERMIKKASPMPPIPNELNSNQSKFSYTVPVHFILNTQ